MLKVIVITQNMKCIKMKNNKNQNLRLRLGRGPVWWALGLREEFMSREIQAAKALWKNAVSHRSEYTTKIAELHKTIISISGVMLSILTAFYTLSETQPNENVLAIQITLLLFLLAILLGVASLYGEAEMHQRIINETAKIQKEKSSVETLDAVSYSSISLSWVYDWTHKLCPIVFFLALALLTYTTICAL